MLAYFVSFARFAGTAISVLAVGLFPPNASSAGSGRVSIRSVIEGSVKECKGSGPCYVDVPVVFTPFKPDPCEIEGMVETIKVFGPMLVVWRIKPVTGVSFRYRFSAGRGIQFVQQAPADPLPTDNDFYDPDYEDWPSGEFINPRGYRWTSNHKSLNTEFHYGINLLVHFQGGWVKCAAADPKIVNKN